MTSSRFPERRFVDSESGPPDSVETTVGAGVAGAEAGGAGAEAGGAGAEAGGAGAEAGVAGDEDSGGAIMGGKTRVFLAP